MRRRLALLAALVTAVGPRHLVRRGNSLRTT